MDTLALLCNLYGDGPPTLRRLRESGCATLAALETFEGERLASLLRTSVRSARRFQCEGRRLRERAEAVSERSSARREVVHSEVVPERAPPARIDPLIGRVLSAWRERDQAAGPQTGFGPAPEVEARADLSAVAATGDLSELEGLDAEQRALLLRAGVGTLAELRDADALALAVAGPLGYTRILHLQFLARRALRARARRDADDVLVPRAPPGERRAAPSLPAAEPLQAVPGPAPAALSTGLRFSPAGPPAPGSGLDFEAELEQFAREARSALERDATGAPLRDEGGSGPFA